MSTTPHLALPLLAAAQAQKHVTHNEALLGLDALVHLAVHRRDLALAPASPAEGDRYIVAAGAAGAWAGRAGEVAVWEDGAWRFHRPRPGWLAYLLDERALVAWTGAAWVAAMGAMGEVEAARLGIGTAASAATPFAAKLNQALFAARGAGEGGTGDLRLALNKEASARTASLLLQSAYSGRAEIGLTGDDDLHLKVSADGAAWAEALRVDRATGLVQFPSGAALPASLRNRLVNGAFTVNQRGQASGAALPAGAYGHDRWRAGAGGASYTFAHDPVGTTLTLGSGSLQQAIEPERIEGGAYTLSWAGSAGARIGLGGPPSGAFAPGPLVVTGVGPGQAVAVEFGPGTLGRAQFEPGPVATGFERRPFPLELLLCQRTYWASNYGAPLGAGIGSVGGFAVSGAILFSPVRFPVRMRVVPSVQVANGGVAGAVRDASVGGQAALNPSNFGGLNAGGFPFLAGSGVLTTGHAYDFDLVANAEL